MGNHYHLLLQTPRANLSRIMRHINGVYTQRHNRLKSVDGPLFRGRFKAILVDVDSYLLQLTRYIHRNPIDMKKPLVEDLSKYEWSSYPAYIGKADAPDWLNREMTYGVLGNNNHFLGYKRFVAKGVDDETTAFYGKGNHPAVFGDEHFREWVYDKKLADKEPKLKLGVLSADIEIKQVVRAVADFYDVEVEALLKVVKGPQNENLPRKVAMHLCQELTGVRLGDIALVFGLLNIGSVSFITHQIRQKCAESHKLGSEIEAIRKSIIKQAN